MAVLIVRVIDDEPGIRSGVARILSNFHVTYPFMDEDYLFEVMEAASAEEGLRRDVVPYHDGGVHGGEIDLGHLIVHAQDGLKSKPPFIRDQELPGGLEPLGLALVPGNQDMILNPPI